MHSTTASHATSSNTRANGAEPAAPARFADTAIDTAVRGLGYDLVAVERAPGGLLRVTIDMPYAGEASRAVNVDDCETVTRQLQHVLEVEGVAYQRLEVSSPGLDRPLRGEADFVRFSGAQVEIALKAAFQGRKRWQGELQRAGDGWRIVLPPPAAKVGGKHKEKRKPAPRGEAVAAAGPADETLDFTLAEVREARLVPTIDFKGRRRT